MDVARLTCAGGSAADAAAAAAAAEAPTPELLRWLRLPVAAHTGVVPRWLSSGHSSTGPTTLAHSASNTMRTSRATPADTVWSSHHATHNLGRQQQMHYAPMPSAWL